MGNILITISKLKLCMETDTSFAKLVTKIKHQHELDPFFLNLIKREKTSKVGVKTKRLKADWDNAYLLKVIGM